MDVIRADRDSERRGLMTITLNRPDKMNGINLQMHEELQRAKAEFRQALTPAQQVRFDELLKQQHRFKEQHRFNSSSTALTNSI